MSARSLDPGAPRGVFVTGTDTGVGKTVVSCALLKALGARGLKVAGLKPVAAGAEYIDGQLRNEDALNLMAAATVTADYDLINPWCLKLPASPHIAATEAGVRVEIGRIVSCYRELSTRSDLVVVEGAGGWLVPISDEETIADIASALKLPVLLVVGLRLGCLNHSLLTFRAIRDSGLELAGWVANHIDPTFDQAAANIETLSRAFGCPPACVIAHGATAAAAAQACAPFAARLGGPAAA